MSFQCGSCPLLKTETKMFCILFILHLRLSEQNKLAADQKRLVAEIRDKLQEYHDWNIKYNVSH